MAGIELVRDKATRCEGRRWRVLRDEGARGRAADARRGEQLVMSPRLIITPAEIDDLLGRLAHALDATAKMVATLP
jgi:adenosylmethionine-8-amino-7-oxononanoate aminotransferase